MVEGAHESLHNHSSTYRSTQEQDIKDQASRSLQHTLTHCIVYAKELGNAMALYARMCVKGRGGKEEKEAE